MRSMCQGTGSVSEPHYSKRSSIGQAVLGCPLETLPHVGEDGTPLPRSANGVCKGRAWQL